MVSHKVRALFSLRTFPNFERYCETIIIIGVETITEKRAANRDTLREPTTPPKTALTLFPAAEASDEPIA